MDQSGLRPDALVRVDSATETFQSWAIPSGIGIIRHVWVTRDKDLLIHQSSSNRIGRVKIVNPVEPVSGLAEQTLEAGQ